MNEQAQAALHSASSDGREQAGKALAEWFGYSWDGMYDRRIADRGFKPWTFNGLGNKEFQGGKRDVLEIIDRIVTLASPASPGANLSRMREALAPLAEIAEAYDDQEDDTFQIFLDCDQRPISQLTLGHCRTARSAQQAAHANTVRSPSGEIPELLERADRYLSTIASRSDAGPHHLVSDRSAALRSVVADTVVA
ncbi:hypothetical protein WDZ92_49980, partial [Nostoc sp. NIES-2111]